MQFNTCPCCGSGQLLRHVRHSGLYWLCTSCRQEILPFEPNPLPRRNPIGQRVRPVTPVG